MKPMPLTHPWRRCTAALLLMLLSACGPGTGGTGTGPIEQPGVPAGAQALPLPLCLSAIATALRCPAASAPGGGGDGSALVLLADAAQRAAVHARVEGNRVELELLCTRQRFSGEWGQRAGEAPRFYGTLQPAAGAPGAATLLARLEGGGLRVELQDALGGPVVSLLLLPVPSLPPAGCA